MFYIYRLLDDLPLSEDKLEVSLWTKTLTLIIIKVFGLGEKFSQKIESLNILLNALASPLMPPTYLKAQRFKQFHPWFERHFGFVSGVFL